jgi:flagellar motor switch protein FliN/FliY
MPTKREHLLHLEVPVIVELGRRKMRLQDVMTLLPGAIIDLGKDAEEELELLINNEVVATGSAVKVGENFGLRLTSVGTRRQRAEQALEGGAAPEAGEDDAAALAEAFLSGQDF